MIIGYQLVQAVFVVTLGRLGGPELAEPVHRAWAPGLRDFDWARITMQSGPRPGREHWPLAHRSISDSSFQYLSHRHGHACGQEA